LKPIVFSAFLFIQVLFGVNIVAVKKVLGIMPASTFNLYRYILAGIILFIAAFIIKKVEFAKLRKYWKLFLISALSGTVIGQMLFAWGINYSSATNASIISITIPLFTLLVSSIRKQVEVTKWKVIGLMGGAIGVGLIKLETIGEFLGTASQGDLFLILGCFFFGITISYSKDFYAEIAVSFGTGACFILGALILLPLTPLNVSNELLDTQYLPWFIFAVIGGTVLPYLIGNWGIKQVDPFTASIFIYIQPVVTGVLAYFLLNEVMTTQKIIASIIIFISVLLTQKDSKSGIVDNKKSHVL